MQCKCGKEIKNVPQHLAGLANWVCRECANPSQKIPGTGAKEESRQNKAAYNFDVQD